MRGPDPMEYGWWLGSRAAGVVALLCITASVAIGLAMAGRVSAQPDRRRLLMAVHQWTALVGLVAIAVHGILLLGDSFMKPGLVGISVPFVIDHKPLWTGLGVTGGWLAAILGLSYWLRDRIGPKRWRAMHRATILVYVLSVAHTLGSGTDAGEPWMRMLVVATGAPVLFLFVMRVLPAPRPSRPAGADYRRFRVAQVVPESRTVTSFALEPVDGKPLPPFEPGQFVSVRVDVPGQGRLVRSYSLSTAPDPGRYRIGVKREELGAVSRHLHDAVRVDDVVELSGPRGTFVLDRDSRRPVVLVSAGIGVTPVLGMLAALARERSEREVWWVHCARSPEEHAFAEEARQLVGQLPAGRSHVRYTRDDGRLTPEAMLEAGAPRDAEFYICGPSRFIDDMREGLMARGVASADVRSERFGPATRTPAPATPEPGAAVEFARSGVSVPWDARFGSLLELAEASDVPVPFSCRVGECGECKTAVTSGEVRYPAEPMAGAQPGAALLCCAQPAGHVSLDV
ncbi:MAG: FAD-binding oxidoreductase [Actinomycetota bacterium]|nr:FAD-binding oxidoreductase [Actinomycetota bacterium]